MLRTNALPSERARRGGAAMALVLAAAAVGLTGLRGPTGAEKTTQPEPEPRPATDPRPALPPQKHLPFDLSYLPPGAQGVVAIRPAAIYGRPEMKEVAELLDGELAKVCEQFGMKQGPKLSIRDVEQVVARLVIQTRKEEKEDQSSMLFGRPLAIRTARNFDWKTLLYAAAPGTAAVEHSGKVYHKLPDRALPALVGPGYCYHLPDARTLVLDKEDNIRKLLERGNKPRPADAWAEDWKRVERALIAVAFDNRDRRWLTDRRQPEEDIPAPAVALFKQATTLVCGFHDTDGVFFEAGVRCDTVKASNGSAEACRELLALYAKAFGLDPEGKRMLAGTTAGRVWKAAHEFLRGMQIHHTPDAVWVWVKGNWGLHDLLWFLA